MTDSSGLLLRDFWATAWRDFVAKRFADAALIVAIFYFAANDNEKLADSFWPLMGIALAASALVWFRDSIAYFMAMFLGEDKRAPLSILHALRSSPIQPAHISPARIDGLKAVANDEHLEAEERIAAATIVSALEASIVSKPWFRRASARDLMDNAILRFTLEHRRAAGLASDDENE